MSPVSRSANSLEPMYASVGHEIPQGQQWTFEPKYDGVRVLAHVTRRSARLVTRNGNDKAKQFPEIAVALIRLAEAAGRSFVMDGEIVALTKNVPARFQMLQSRMHLQGEQDILTQVQRIPTALMAFDLVRDGTRELLSAPWTDRRGHLQTLFSETQTALEDDARFVRRYVRLVPSTRGRGKAMLERARRDGWEGVIAKRVDASYQPSVRSDAWLKLKIEFRQEFVVGGFTEPRNSREHIGALILGYFDEAGRLIYVGHTGGGFTRASLQEMRKKLDRLVRKTSPFSTTPKTNEPATWVKPVVVVEVKFNEWTDDGRLRQPIYLGTRDDKSARSVTKEALSVQSSAAPTHDKL